MRPSQNAVPRALADFTHNKNIQESEYKKFVSAPIKPEPSEPPLDSAVEIPEPEPGRAWVGRLKAPLKHIRMCEYNWVHGVASEHLLN